MNFSKLVPSVFYIDIADQKSLFTFINYDGVSWHNNSAERALRPICTQRKISGYLFGSTTPSYLRLLSIMQTCKLNNKSFFKISTCKRERY